MTHSTRCAAVWAMRRPAHAGQKPRRLQLKASSTACLQVSHPMRRKPWAKIPHCKESCATRWLKGGDNFQASHEAIWPYNSISMRVQVPPLRCRGESLSPNPATGPQRVEAGANGETLKASFGPLASQESMGSESKDVPEPS